MKITFTPGQRVQTSEVGDFFRLLSTVGPVVVEFYYQGREIAERRDVEAGFAEQFKVSQFDRVDITSATAQTVQWETALGSEIRYDRGAATVNGVLALTGEQSAFVQAQKTVTTASAQMLAAKANRRYLLVQNKDTAGIIYVTLEGTAATVVNGIRIGPGESLEIAGFCPLGAINAIGSIASNANIVTAEG
jgi:hypothetical protein